MSSVNISRDIFLGATNSFSSLGWSFMTFFAMHYLEDEVIGKIRMLLQLEICDDF